MSHFQQLKLISPLERALREQRYASPKPIQAQTIPAAIAGHDILGSAQTGTGKTAAFALPTLHRLGDASKKATPRRPAALVLAPTRELAIQIGDRFRCYGKYLRLRVSMIYGGVNQFHQVRELERGAHIVVATPGRLLDLMSQGHIGLDGLKIFVLDEADRMLDMGFLPDLKRIFAALPSQRQSMFFSATLPPKIRELSQQLLRHPKVVDVTPETVSVEKINQSVMLAPRSAKLSILSQLLSGREVQRAIVFTKTKRGADRLAEKLTQQGVGATAIHGNKSQAARQKALAAFRQARIRVLVATDLAARGIDVDGVTHVFNFDLPIEPENYVHRVGRTGRAGASGVAVSLCAPDERKLLLAIERVIGAKVGVVPSPIKSPQETPRPHVSRRQPKPEGTASGGTKFKRRRRRPGRAGGRATVKS